LEHKVVVFRWVNISFNGRLPIRDTEIMADYIIYNSSFFY